MKTIKFRYVTAHKWRDPEISKVEIDKETEKSIWINGRRYAKASSYESYFDSWNEAAQSALSVHKKIANEVESRLDCQREILEKINAMENPDE